MAELAAVTVPIKELPPEVWKQILSNVDDQPTLMTCRLVSKCWRDLSSEVLSESVSFWTTTFEDRVGRRRATHFSASDQITRFMSEMKRSTNPFPNGTVIFNFAAYLIYKEIDIRDSCRLLDTFKDAILNLVCDICPFALDDLYFRMFLLRILDLKNLKGLVIKCCHWESLKFSRYITSRGPFEEVLELKSLPERLTNIHIHGENGVIPLVYMFGGAQSTLKSVSSLEIVNNVDRRFIHLPQPMCQLPNLKKLKVRYPNAVFLKQFQQFQPNCVASLKEVSLHFYGSGFEFSRPSPAFDLKETFALLDYHAESLEFLLLELKNTLTWYFGLPLPPIQLNTSVKYGKLKILVLCYFNIKDWPVIRELMEKLVNLQEFKLIQPDFRAFDEQLSLRDQYEIVMDCWNHLPASVKIINVPTYGWKIKRGETLQFNDDGEQVE